MSSFHLWLTLAAGCIGVVMGINRTIKTREHESWGLRYLSAIAGFLLIGVSIYAVFTAGGPAAGTSHAVPLMMILGLSLSARQLESIPVTAVFMLILGLGVLSVIGYGGMPESVSELLHSHNLGKLIISGVLLIGGAIALAVFTVEKLVDLVLNALGLGIVVIVLSAVSIVHAGLVLYTGDGRGLLKFM